MEKLAQDGYLRARINGELVQLDETPVLDKRKNHSIEVVVDRLLVKPGIAARLEQSIATALKLAAGLVTVSIVVKGEPRGVKLQAFPCLSWSRVHSASILPTARVRRAMASARNTISIPRGWSSTGRGRSSMAG